MVFQVFHKFFKIQLPIFVDIASGENFLLRVLAQRDAQALQPLLQLSDVHHAVPIAVQRPEERFVACGRLRVVAGGDKPSASAQGPVRFQIPHG